MPAALPIPPTGLNPLALSASGLVKTGAGDLHIMVVSSSTALTVKLWDNTAASGTVILDTMAVNAGEEYDLPFHFNTGLYATLAGTGSITLGFI